MSILGWAPSAASPRGCGGSPRPRGRAPPPAQRVTPRDRSCRYRCKAREPLTRRSLKACCSSGGSALLCSGGPRSPRLPSAHRPDLCVPTRGARGPLFPFVRETNRGGGLCSAPPPRGRVPSHRRLRALAWPCAAPRLAFRSAADCRQRSERCGERS